LHIQLSRNTNSGTEAVQWAEKELPQYTNSWINAAWEEIDWQRIKEMEIRDILDKRQAQAEISQSCTCLQCPNFADHVSILPLLV
jgi:antiviral helicase SKI2